MNTSIRQDQHAGTDGLALAAATLAQCEGDRLGALIRIRNKWRTRPDEHERQVGAIAYAAIAEKLEPAERDVWTRFHVDAEVTPLARVVAARHRQYIPTARTRQVAA